MFYVYEHWRPDRGLYFYVGKGYGGRAHNFKRNSHYNWIVGKLHRLGWGVEVRFVARGLTEAEAHRLEIERIAFWRSSGIKLANATCGGEGITGYRHTDATRKQMSVPKSIQHRKNISLAKLGKKQGPHTLECKAKLRAAKLGKKDSDKVRANKARAARNRSKEHLANLSAALKGRPLPKEHCEKLRVSARTRPPISEVTHDRMRQAQRKRRASTLVSDLTRARQVASIKAWHAAQGHRIT